MFNANYFQVAAQVFWATQHHFAVGSESLGDRRGEGTMDAGPLSWSNTFHCHAVFGKK